MPRGYEIDHYYMLLDFPKIGFTQMKVKMFQDIVFFATCYNLTLIINRNLPMMS